MNIDKILVSKAANVNQIIGVGCSSSASMGDATVNIRAKKLQNPSEVAANIVGNTLVCAT